MRKMVIRVLEALNSFIDYMVNTWVNKVVAVLLALSIMFVSSAVHSIVPLLAGMPFVVILFYEKEKIFDFKG